MITTARSGAAPRRPFSPVIAPLTILLLVALGGCASTPAASSASPADAPRASDDGSRRETPPSPGGPDGSATSSADPAIAIVWVNGMGCPLCATNVDQSLRRVDGVTSVNINLGTGMLRVGLDPTKPPTEAQLSRAIDDSGFTLVRIQMPQPAAGGGA